MELTTEFIRQVFYASILNSFIVYGILQTVNKIIEKKVHRFIGIGLTYVGGYLCTFYFGMTDIVFILITGMVIGCLSVGIYKSAVQSLLEVVPAIVNKFLK